MFANLLAEVRKYGEGLIIADQIPNKLVPDVIKNTNTKIVHRLFAADDRNTIGDAMGLTDEQKAFLPMLQPGETVIFCGGWHAPVRLKVTERASTRGRGLDESQIQRSGQEQLWAQRAYLLPRLAQHPGMTDAATLSTFMRDATLMFSILLRLNPKGQPQPALVRERLRERLLNKVNPWLGDQRMDEDALADGLTRLFRDGAVTALFTRDADFALLRKTLHQGVERLQTSLSAFDAFAKGPESNEVFTSLAPLNSL
jgi:hypothetical protein